MRAIPLPVVLLCLALFVPAARSEPVVLPGGSVLQQVDFERHVQALFGKLGCNAGACHGSFQGKGGLYLSLFGWSPEKDHHAFTRDAMGRRISVSGPDSSLLLLKATGQVPHGGGVRLATGSWQYKIFREWIAGGASWTPGSGAVKNLQVTPAEQLFARPGEKGRFQVLVEFEDGNKQDVTAFCQFTVNDEYVAELAGPDSVKGVRPGDTAVVVSYRGNVRSARAFVKAEVAPNFVYPRVAEVNHVDREVFGKLRKLNIVPSDLSSDAEFLRRITIDTIACLPSPDEVRKFLADPDPEKRAKKIDELLKHPLHAALWATKFSDITGNSVEVLEQAQTRTKRSKMWHDWFRKRIQDNVPYDEIARGVLTATSRDGLSVEEWVKQTLAIEQQLATGWETDYAERASLDLFWRRQRFPVEQIGEHTAAAFLGIRLECAQCHKHPFDRWTQDDYRSYSQVFANVRFTTSNEAQQMLSRQQAELRKKMTEELAVVEKEHAEKKKPIEDKIDLDYAEKRKDGEAKVEKDIADRTKAFAEKLAKEPEEKRKASQDRFDREMTSLRKRSLATLDAEIKEKKRQALAEMERAFTKRKADIQAKYRLGNTQLREVSVGTPVQPPRQATRPATPAPTPKALGGPMIEGQADPRVALFDWMRASDNPFFARAFVNRVWAHYFGRGIVDPVDNFSVANPPSNDKLLDALAQDFIASKFDIRKLERTILLSRTYQLSAVVNDSNRLDRSNYSHSFARRLMAEQVVDVLNTALGVTENFGPEVPPNIRAIEIAPSRLQQSPNLTNMMRIFGRPTRTTTCDCERPQEPSLPQTLFLWTDPVLLKKITDGRLKELLASKKGDEEVIEELMLATLSRLPRDEEKKKLLDHIAKQPSRQAGFVDVVWVLINMREFILNH